MKREKKPLYRKVNTKARRVHHQFGGSFKKSRHKKRQTREQVFGSMKSKVERGLDYTPLFRFLLSKVGTDWNEIHAEAISRLDKPDPLFWIVAKQESEKQDYVRVGESSYFSGLYIDSNNQLQLSNPELKAKDMVPSCSCCTHTLNGVVFGTE